MRAVLGAFALCVLASCDRGSSSAPARSTSAGPTSSVVARPPSTGTPSASATASAVPNGSAVPPFAYEPYVNDRFGFAVDYPAFFTASEPPTNGDGQEWTWGTRATMRAWGMHAFDTITQLCDEEAKDNPTFFKKVTGKTCLITGKKDGKIVWQKRSIRNDLIFGMDLEYDEALKTAFDPLVEHVNASQRTGMPAQGP